MKQWRFSMPAPVGRDLEATRLQLEGWFAKRIPEAREIELGELSGPGSTGFSSDTLIFDLHYKEASEAITRGLVVRIHPSGFQLFPDYDLPAQYRVMKSLEDSDVVVPKMLWEEHSAELLGSPFYVMEKVEGHAPSDNPPYTAKGWLREMGSEDQSRLWSGYIDTLVAVHRLDPYELGLDFLAKPELGDTPIEQELAYYGHFYRWSFGSETDHPYISASLSWLRANRPPTPDRAHLVWGDARIGNMLFQGPRCVAVLDWEMARLGDPMMDLAWGLFMDRYHSEGNSLPRLAGFPSREETIALYEERTGRSTIHLEYFEILAGMRFSVILTRLAKQLEHYGFLPPKSNFEVDNPVSNLHRKQLEELGIL
jgi:aminoglycoside phosphotransferase (APT) family kinase protein